MRDPTDNRTLEMPGLEQRRGPGRPRKVDALTPAQRARRYRLRKAWRAAQAARLETARYVGPGGETWSGKGKRPIWIDVLIARGYSLESMDQWARRAEPADDASA